MWRVLNSADFGVPQSRKRVYIVGHLGNKCPVKILSFTENDENNFSKIATEQLIPGSQGSRVYSSQGLAVTQCSGSGGVGAKTGLYLIDMNENPIITERQDSGVSNQKGEHSAVFVTEEKPRAMINPFKENARQNGRRIKEPDEDMFTLTATDRHGVVHKGRIRRLIPLECWRLQGFSDEQFFKVQSAGLSDAQLYKQAGNAVTTKVIQAIGENILKYKEENL